VISIHEVPAHVLNLPVDLENARVAEYCMHRLLPLVLSRAQDFLGLSETQALLDQLEQVAPASVRQVVPKPVALATLNEVLKRLVEESISIRDLKAILEALAQIAHTEKDPLNLAEFVRSQLRRPITYSLTGGAKDLHVCLLDRQIEDTIRSSISRTAAGSFLTLAPAAGRDIVRSVKTALDEDLDGAPVLLTQPDIRRFVRKLLETDLPEIRVVSYADLLPELNLRPVATARPSLS
jgi:type III secretion protein V